MYTHAHTPHTHTCGISELKAPVGDINVCMGLHQDVELRTSGENVKRARCARVSSQQRGACISPVTHNNVVTIRQVNVHTLQFNRDEICDYRHCSPDSSMMSMHYHQTEMGSRVKDIALLTVQHLSTLIKQKRDGLRPQIILLLKMDLSSGDRKLT